MCFQRQVVARALAPGRASNDKVVSKKRKDHSGFSVVGSGNGSQTIRESAMSSALHSSCKSYAFQGKKKGMVLYSAVSSPLDRSKRFTLSSPGIPFHSDTVIGFSWKHSSQRKTIHHNPLSKTISHWPNMESFYSMMSIKPLALVWDVRVYTRDHHVDHILGLVCEEPAYTDKIMGIRTLGVCRECARIHAIPNYA